MAKPGNQNHKKRYERYKNSGRREENKLKKQQRAEKLKAKFAARKEEGKTYEYKPNPYKKDSAEYRHEELIRSRKNEAYGHKTECQKWTSIFAKLTYENEKLKKLAKASEKTGKGTRHPSPQDDEYDAAY